MNQYICKGEKKEAMLDRSNTSRLDPPGGSRDISCCHVEHAEAHLVLGRPFGLQRRVIQGIQTHFSSGADKVGLLVVDCPHTSRKEAKAHSDDAVERNEHAATLPVSLSLSILSGTRDRMTNESERSP